MLASTFLTAEKLGIPEECRQVLIEFHRMATSGEIIEERFDMQVLKRRTKCGTAGCILGWCQMIDAEAGRELAGRWFGGHARAPLGLLFSSGAPHQKLEAAAEAVFRYLSTGDV